MISFFEEDMVRLQAAIRAELNQLGQAGVFPSYEHLELYRRQRSKITKFAVLLVGD
jgi:hypothetical protein